jgi:hypothetical protein
MGADDNTEFISHEIASQMSESTKFPVDRDEVYFYIREGFANQKNGEGFAKEIKVISEMLNGEAIIDGWRVYDLSIGDNFYVTADPKYALTTLKLDFDL